MKQSLLTCLLGLLCFTLNASPSSSPSDQPFACTVVISSPTTILCPGSTTLLTATVSGNTTAVLTYQWKLNGTDILLATSAGYTASTAGSYTVTVGGTGCAVAITSAAYVVTASTLVAGVITGVSEFCQGGSTLLTANPTGGTAPYLYQWKLDGAPVGIAGTLIATVGGKHTIVITDQKGCVVTSAEKVITANPLPVANAGPGGTRIGSETYSPGMTTATNGTAPYSYQWTTTPSVSGNGSIEPIPTFGPFTQSTTIFLALKDSKGCAASAQAVVSTAACPLNVAISPSSDVVCAGGTVTLMANVTNSSGALSYQWQNNSANLSGANGPSYVTSNTGAYQVTVKDARGCSATAAGVGISSSNPSVTVVSNNGQYQYCDAGKANFITLVANPAGGVGSYSYSWNNGPPSKVIDVFEGDYIVTVTDSKGCKAQSPFVSVRAFPKPIANAGPGGTITGTDRYVPTGVITANGGSGSGFSYQWTSTPGVTVTPNNSTGAGQPAIGPFTQNTSIFLTVTDSRGCQSDPSTAQITYIPCQMTSKLTGSNYVCAGGSTILTVTATSNYGVVTRYQWRLNGATQGSDSTKLQVVRGGLYVVSSIDPKGCHREDTLQISEAPRPAVNLAGSESFCKGSNATLTASVSGGSPKYTYHWLNGVTVAAGDSSKLITEAGGTYTVTVTDAKGCVNTSNAWTVTLLGADLTALINASGPTTVYAPNVVTLNANTGLSYVYQWRKNNNDIAGATLPTYDAKETGSYLVGISRDGCQVLSQPIAITVIIPTAVAPIIVGEFTIKAFPNPTTGRLQVDVSLEKPQALSLYLMDLTGRVLSQYNTSRTSTHHVAEFDLSGQMNGMYLLRIEAGEQRAVQKVVKAN